MGAAIRAVPKTFSAINADPTTLLGAAVVSGIGSVVLGFVLGLIPVVGPILNAVFVTPLFAAGFIAVANAAMEGDSSFDDYVSGISDNYLSMVGAYALLMGIMLVFVLGFVVVVALIVGFGSMSGGGAAAEPSAAAASNLAAIGGVAIVMILLGSLFMFLVFAALQFIDVSIVVGDESAFSSFKRSVGLFTSAPISVLGYSLLRGVLGAAIVGVPTLLVGGAAVTAMESTASLAVTGLTYLLLLPVGFVVGYGYHVAYFRERAGVAA